jgi:hypothetical protein
LSSVQFVQLFSSFVFSRVRFERQGAADLLVFTFVAERARSSFSRCRSDFPLKLDFCRRLALVFRSPVDRTLFPGFDILSPHSFGISRPHARSGGLAAARFRVVRVPCRCVFGPCAGQIPVWVSCGQISYFALLKFWTSFLISSIVCGLL